MGDLPALWEHEEVVAVVDGLRFSMNMLTGSKYRQLWLPIPFLHPLIRDLHGFVPDLANDHKLFLYLVANLRWKIEETKGTA